MSTEHIKLQIFRQIDALDGNKIKELYGLMQNYLNSNKEDDEWFGIGKNEQEGIRTAINELNEGKGIPHQELMTKLKNKFSTLSHA